MIPLSFTELPRTDDPRQVFTVDMAIDGAPLHARVELRYLSAPDRWVISIRDNASSELLNDLLLPFRHIRDGAGAGSLFVIRNTDEPSSADPAKGNLTEFSLLWGDTLKWVE